MSSAMMITSLLSKQSCARVVQALTQIPTSISSHEAASSRPCDLLVQRLQPMMPKQSAFSVLNGMLLSPQMQAAIDSLRHDSSLQKVKLLHGLDLENGRLQQLHSPEVIPVEEPNAKTTSCEAEEPSPLMCGKRGTSYQPSRRKRVNSHGIEKRLSTFGGRNILMRRLLKQKRSRLTVDCFV